MSIEIFRGSTSTGDHYNHHGSYSVGVDNTSGDLPDCTILLYWNQWGNKIDDMLVYCIVQNSGGVKLWLIDCFRILAKENFSEFTIV